MDGARPAAKAWHLLQEPVWQLVLHSRWCGQSYGPHWSRPQLLEIAGKYIMYGSVASPLYSSMEGFIQSEEGRCHTQHPTKAGLRCTWWLEGFYSPSSRCEQQSKATTCGRAKRSTKWHILHGLNVRRWTTSRWCDVHSHDITTAIAPCRNPACNGRATHAIHCHRVLSQHVPPIRSHQHHIRLIRTGPGMKQRTPGPNLSASTKHVMVVVQVRP